MGTILVVGMLLISGYSAFNSIVGAGEYPDVPVVLVLIFLMDHVVCYSWSKILAVALGFTVLLELSALFGYEVLARLLGMSGETHTFSYWFFDYVFNSVIGVLLFMWGKRREVKGKQQAGCDQ